MTTPTVPDPARPALDDRVAVVTGGASGIGREIARAFHAAGASVVIADRDVARAEEVAAGLGGSAQVVDVVDPGSVRDAVSAIVERHGRIDVLVTSAGIVRNGPAEDTTDADWRDVFAVNCDGLFWCCREVGRVMLAAGHGSIVNIASMSGIVVNRPQGQAAYNASKAAVIGLTKSLAAEWAPRGVRVNAIAPGYVATELTLRGMSDPAWREEWLRSTPMGRVAQPEEIGPGGGLPRVGCGQLRDRQRPRHRRWLHRLVTSAGVDLVGRGVVGSDEHGPQGQVGHRLGERHRA